MQQHDAHFRLWCAQEYSCAAMAPAIHDDLAGAIGNERLRLKNERCMVAGLPCASLNPFRPNDGDDYHA